LAEYYEYRLTTKDNPFNPFDQFDSWLRYDMDNIDIHGGVSTCDILARFAHTSDDLSPKEYAEEINRAITKIMSIDPLDIYRRVRKKVEYDDD
jgi:hypothetical protein